MPRLYPYGWSGVAVPPLTRFVTLPSPRFPRVPRRRLPIPAFLWSFSALWAFPATAYAQAGDAGGSAAEAARAYLRAALRTLEHPALPPHTGTLVLGAVLLLVLWKIGRSWRRVPGGSPGLASRAPDRRAARIAARRGDHLEAGRLYEEAGDGAAAAAAYERGRAFMEAGRAWEGLNQLGKAARAYERANEFGRAADLCVRLGNFARASSLFQKDGQETRAAEAAARAGDRERAATLFEKCDACERAGDLRLQLGHYARAAELLERALRRLRAAGEEGAESAAVQPLARRCAEAYAKAGRPAKAGALLRGHGLELEAAERYAEAGDWESAFQLFLRQRAFDRAAALCRTLGRERDLSLVEGERAAAEGREAAAARAFEAAGVWWRATDLYQRVGAYAKAAEMASRQGDEERAAEMHAAAGDFRAAAAALTRLGKPAEAAQYYAQAGLLPEAAGALRAAGEFFEAGKLLLQAGAEGEAMALLQQVGSGSSRYLEATILLGDLFFGRDLLGPAREKYERAVALRPIASDFVHPTYQLARIQERQGNLEEALHLYEKVVAEQFEYEDVQARLQVLRDRLAGATHMVPEAETARADGPSARSRYRIVTELGRGGMGIVYRAEDQLLQRPVALKVLSGALREDSKAVEEFLREARIAAALHHPNIVTVYDAGELGDEVYIAMEFVEGRSVEQLLDERGALPVPQAVDILRQACQSLVHAHRQRIVHRDVKPANMMLTEAGVVKLMDFGLAAVVSRATAKVTSVRGTPFYMAPEQILGQSASTLADQYSLGCTLYHMLTGRPPFVEGDVLYHHIHTDPTSPRRLNPTIPLWLDAIVLRTMLKVPEKRFPSVADLLNAVEECLRSVRTGPFLEAGPR